MKILYIGDNSASSTSFHRAAALQRLGHYVDFFVPTSHFKSTKILSALNYRTGYRFIQHKLFQAFQKIDFDNQGYELVWINSGEWIGENIIQFIKKRKTTIILYNNDDPTGYRDGNRFNTLKKVLGLYDLCVVRKEKREFEYQKFGVRKILKIHMSYDEIEHQPFEELDLIPSKYKSEIVFIGTWIRSEKRDYFFLKLIEAGLPISIWGSRWEKSKIYHKLKPYHKGGNLAGRDYVAAIQGAKICIGLLSQNNGDLHTRRSVEIPFAGGLLCAQRTSEHSALYEEGKEAIFWEDVDECIAKCRWLLNNDLKREEIRKNGMIRVRQNDVGNTRICQKIIDHLLELNLIS